MADQPAAADQALPKMPNISIRNQYVKDMSFENIARQKNVNAAEKPDVKVGVKLAPKKISESDYEVTLIFEVKASAGEDALFLLEIEYAGLFHIEDFTAQQLPPILMIECPRLIFPYVRRLVSDITRDGGYPPVNVDNIDFLKLYRDDLLRRQQQQQQQAENGVAGTA